MSAKTAASYLPTAIYYTLIVMATLAGLTGVLASMAGHLTAGFQFDGTALAALYCAVVYGRNA